MRNHIFEVTTAEGRLLHVVSDTALEACRKAGQFLIRELINGDDLVELAQRMPPEEVKDYRGAQQFYSGLAIKEVSRAPSDAVIEEYDWTVHDEIKNRLADLRTPPADEEASDATD